jgi:hypothetical protein
MIVPITGEGAGGGPLVRMLFRVVVYGLNLANMAPAFGRCGGIGR